MKSAIRILIDKFGIEKINDTIASILFEEANATERYEYDDLGELYDNINKSTIMLSFKRKYKHGKLSP